MKMSEREHVHVSCLIDHLQGLKSIKIREAAESLAMFMGTKEIGSSSGLPTCIQYSQGVGNFSQHLCQHNIKSAVLFDSPEAFDFTSELLSQSPEKYLDLILIEDPIKLEDSSFPLCPNGDGWQIVILDDIVSSICGDADLIPLLRSIASTMVIGGYLIIHVVDMAKNGGWSKEFNNSVVTESFEKTSLRKYARTITSHGAVTTRHVNTMYSFAVSDLHECARQACFRPNREMGLDPSEWCCYERV